jgi:hypothetical protein
MGLTLTGKIYQRYFDGGMDGQDAVGVFTHLR